MKCLPVEPMTMMSNTPNKFTGCDDKIKPIEQSIDGDVIQAIPTSHLNKPREHKRKARRM
jgi:hypothetical protein